MSTDLTIIGAGICGLWTAHYAVRAGMSVTLIDKGAVGSGGSYGLLGALAPHLPDSSNDKKRFHWQALDELPGLAAQLEEQTGLSSGYGQTGRLMPVRVEGFAKRMDRCIAGAPEHWQLGERQYEFKKIETSLFADWINADLAPMGLIHDTLSARAAPRLVTSALKAALLPRVKIIEDFEFGHFDEASGRVVSRDGAQVVVTKNLVISAGFESYPLLKSLLGVELGHGVKGHTALFRLAGVASMPALYDNGVYVVPHADGTVAVGSSSQDEWSGEHKVEEGQCSAFIERAFELCPRLQQGELIEKWAGVRPRSHAKDPMLGQLPDHRNIFILSGGFKISFGIAHRLARALVQRIAGQAADIELPPSYELSYHLAQRRAIQPALFTRKD